MLRQSFHELTIPTHGRGLYDFTDEIESWIAKGGFTNGLVTLHLRHTSASLLIQENADPDVRADLERFFKRLVSDGDPIFVHTCEGKDDMPAHIRTALTTVNLSLPLHGNTPHQRPHKSLDPATGEGDHQVRRPLHQTRSLLGGPHCTSN